MLIFPPALKLVQVDHLGETACSWPGEPESRWRCVWHLSSHAKGVTRVCNWAVSQLCSSARKEVPNQLKAALTTILPVPALRIC